LALISASLLQYQLLAAVNVVCIVVLMVLFTITGSMVSKALTTLAAPSLTVPGCDAQADKSGMDFFAEMLWMSFGQLYDGIGGEPVIIASLSPGPFMKGGRDAKSS